MAVAQTGLGAGSRVLMLRAADSPARGPALRLRAPHRGRGYLRTGEAAGRPPERRCRLGGLPGDKPGGSAGLDSRRETSAAATAANTFVMNSRNRSMGAMRARVTCQFRAVKPLSTGLQVRLARLSGHASGAAQE